MNLPSLSEVARLTGPTLQKLNLKGKRVLLRLDLDVPVERGRVTDDFRLQAGIPTIKYLLEKEASKITILGHRGRPEGKLDKKLSLAPVAKQLEKILEKELNNEEIAKLEMEVLENLRFNPKEEENSAEFAKELARDGDVYVNDAFAASHREHASIVALPLEFKSKSKNAVAAGLHLIEEVETLGKVLENPQRPLDIVLGGGKLEKALLIPQLLNQADWVLVGGVLPQKVKSYCRDDGKMCVAAAHLTRDAEDITPDAARNFSEIIKTAQTLVWNGPMGDIDKGFWESTEIVAEAVAKSRAFKVVGGGDTIRALRKLGLLEKIDYVSTGGGAMVELLAFGDLPGLKALRE